MPDADASNPIEAVRARLDGGRRWVNNPGSGDETMCLVVAAGRIDYADSTKVSGLMGEVAREQYPDRTGVEGGDDKASALVVAVIRFNDHPDTTWADVDLVLDKASVRWDEQVR